MEVPSAIFIRDYIAQRLAGWKLGLNPAKTPFVYCKDADRRGSYEHEQFDFLGYTFRPRLSRSKFGKNFVNFTPAVSDDAAKTMRQEIRQCRLQERSDKALVDLARMFNPIVQGWINYYGRFYRSELYPVLRPINDSWFVRLSGSTSGCGATPPGHGDFWLRTSLDGSQGSSPTGGWGCCPTAGQWEPGCAERCTPGSARARG